MSLIKKNSHNAGFTLIELLFIIVIIGVLAALALTSFQQRATNIKIEKTAIEMQEILQAATTYFGDNNRWPTGPTCPTGIPDFAPYLPQNIANNPWGKAYFCQPDPNKPTNFQVFSGQVPNTQIANRIRSLLPNASLSVDNSQIIANSVPIRGPLIIQHIGISNLLVNGSTGGTGIDPFIFSCPSGWSPQALALPVFIGADPLTKACLPSPGSKPIGGLNPSGLGCSPTGTSNQYQCTYVVHFHSEILDPSGFFSCLSWTTTGTGYIKFAEIGYCTPPGETVPAINL